MVILLNDTKEDQIVDWQATGLSAKRVLDAENGHALEFGTDGRLSVHIAHFDYRALIVECSEVIPASTGRKGNP
jgi:hypothetical protein